MPRQKISFEEALEKLEQIVADIEEGRSSIEESIEKYAEGIRLIKQCRQILDAAEKKIQILAKDESGELRPAGELDDEPDSTEDSSEDDPPNEAEGVS